MFGVKLTENEVLERFKQVHGDKYDYSKFSYKGQLYKSIIICPIHGEFEQTPAKHWHQKQECFHCGKKKAGNTKRVNQSSKKNIVENQPTDFKLIPLGRDRFAMVDNEDYERVADRCWKYSKGYATSTKFGAMHRFVMNAPDDMFVDHKFRNTLDNRKQNLRIVTPQQNTFNSVPYGKSKYKGVSWNNQNNKWYVQIVHNHTTVCRESFDDEIEAAKYYDSQIEQYHGEFAYYNFPKEKINV